VGSGLGRSALVVGGAIGAVAAIFGLSGCVAAEPEPVAPEPVPNAPAPVVEWGPAYDTGPRPGATATPVLDGNGVPFSYTVVEGDSFFDIAQRFELPQQQLLRMNPQIHDYGETVYIGDLINLDWTKTG